MYRGTGSAVVELSEGQLSKLAELIHFQEVEKLKELKFNSYADQQKYLKDSKAAHENVDALIKSAQAMKASSQLEQDATKNQIAHDIYTYMTKSIGMSLTFIRSYDTRLTYLDKLKTHSQDLIKQLKQLDPVTQMKEAQRLALEAGMYKKAAIDTAQKFQKHIPNQFSKWLKDTSISFEDLVQQHMSKLGFRGPFKNLKDIEKLQVYEGIMEAAGQGKTGLTYTMDALGSLGVAALVFTAGIMVWDIYTAENKVETAVRDAVNALGEVVDLTVGELVNVAIEVGFEALDIEIASAALSVIGAVAGFGVGVLIGMATGALLDLIFSSGTSKVHTTDGLKICRVAPMPNGLELARLIKHKYPNL